MIKNEYENPLTYDIMRDAYQMEIPKPITVHADTGKYEVAIVEVLGGEYDVFNIVTSFENYNYTVGEFVKNPISLITPEIRILILYYDQDLGLHATMAARATIQKMDDVSVMDVSYRINRKVKSFQEWQSASQT